MKKSLKCVRECYYLNSLWGAPFNEISRRASVQVSNIPNKNIQYLIIEAQLSIFREIEKDIFTYFKNQLSSQLLLKWFYTIITIGLFSL